MQHPQRGFLLPAFAVKLAPTRRANHSSITHSYTIPNASGPIC